MEGPRGQTKIELKKNRMVKWKQKNPNRIENLMGSLIGKLKERNGRRSEDGSVWRSNKGGGGVCSL